MSEIALYKSAKGYAVTSGSYSARETFRYCPRKFYLRKVEGWQQIEQRASTLFGRCIEDGWQAYEENYRAPGVGIQRFTEKWKLVAESPSFSRLTYTDDEGDWTRLLRAGREMMRLYEIVVPRLPVSVDPKPRFQVPGQPLRKKIFPGTELDVLQNVAYLDMISFPAWDHHALAPAPNPTGAAYRPLIIDCKTSGVEFPEEIIALDPQLAEYAWQARIPDVAFLNFIKNSHSIERKSRVTLMERVGGIPAGTELYVLGTDRPEQPKVPRRKKGEPKPPPPPKVSKEITTLFLGDAWALGEYQKAMQPFHPSSNDYKNAAKSFFTARFVVSCAPSVVTKQRIQFAAARIDEETINETGRAVGQDTVEMVRAHNEGFYPRTGGIRFPNQKCQFCEMRGICGNNPELRDSLLTRAGEEWFSGAEEE